MKPFEKRNNIRTRHNANGNKNLINEKVIYFNMATSIETIHQEIVGIKKDLQFIKIALSENYELSDYAKDALKKARETSELKYVDLE